MELSYHRPADYGELRALIDALGAELGPELERSMGAWFGRQPRPYPLDPWQILVARDAGNGTDVGILGYYRHQGDRPGRFWIGWLAVVPQARRQGIGAQLLDRVVQEAAQAGATELWVYTEPDNHAAIAFYQAHGMVPRGRFADLDLPQAAATADSVVFAKALS